MQTVRTVRQPPELPPQLYEILPRQLCAAVSRCGAARIEELRLHRNRFATVTCSGKNYSTGILLREDEMNDILRSMCGGSLYAFSQSINQGYLTMEGGIRVGICGSAAVEDGRVIGVSNITGLILRIPNPISVSAESILKLLRAKEGSGGVLLYSPPGIGKTTLLRAAILEAAGICSMRTVVVDTREELAPTLNGNALCLDVLVGYPREIGIEIAVRSLGAELIVCDEIGGLSDARAILHAANCGVPLLASAHANSTRELLRRPSMQLLHRAAVFGHYVGLTRPAGKGLQHQICAWEDAEHVD